MKVNSKKIKSNTKSIVDVSQPNQGQYSGRMLAKPRLICRRTKGNRNVQQGANASANANSPCSV